MIAPHDFQVELLDRRALDRRSRCHCHVQILDAPQGLLQEVAPPLRHANLQQAHKSIREVGHATMLPVAFVSGNDFRQSLDQARAILTTNRQNQKCMHSRSLCLRRPHGKRAAAPPADFQNCHSGPHAEDTQAA